MTQLFAADLAARRKIIVLGDSISAFAIETEPGISHGSWSNHGYVAWLRRYLTQSVNLPMANVFAVPGVNVSSVVANQLPAAIASGADIAIVHCGINSIIISPEESFSTITAGLTMIYRSLLNAGMFVIAIPIRATTDPNALSGTNLLKFSAVNTFIASFCAKTSGMLLIDVNPTYLDFSTGKAQPQYLNTSGPNADGIHDVQLGAMTMAQLLANVISPLVPTTDDAFMHIGDVYDSANNITGNLLNNGLLTGTGGTLANGATGTVPNGWTGYRSIATSTTTLAFSQVPDPTLTNLTRTRMTVGTVSGTADGINLALQQRLNVGVDLAVGDALTAEAACTWSITTGGMTSIGLHIVCFDGSSNVLDETFDGDPDNLWGDMPTGSGTVVYRTDPLTIPSGTVFISVDVTLMVPAASGVAATVDWSRISVRKVV